MSSFMGRGNQYIELVKVLYCKLPTNSKQLPAFPLEVRPAIKLRSQKWLARVLPLCHHGPKEEEEEEQIQQHLETTQEDINPDDANYMKNRI